MKGAKAAVQCLLEEGVDTIFGYPGGMILPLYDALYDEKKITQILTTHEQNAAHAADGYARATGKVGVCIAKQRKTIWWEGGRWFVAKGSGMAATAI